MPGIAILVQAAPDWVWLRDRFPWLGDGFIHAVHDDQTVVFVRELRQLGFTIVTIQPRRAADFHHELAVALRFPDWHEMNWDAVHDSMRDFAFEHPFALIWRRADRIASEDPKLFAEATATITREFEDLDSRHAGVFRRNW